ncbi:hypothetical protein [Streptomyces hokutonensis]|uniref:hypothetical protein n=1 Tax=Streptomyces hokutonensis TaxID=1306990 RepID=UPI0037FFE215
MSKATSSNRLLSADTAAEIFGACPAHGSAENNKPDAGGDLITQHPCATPTREHAHKWPRIDQSNPAAHKKVGRRYKYAANEKNRDMAGNCP